MWCPVCHADVATELSADHRRLNCTRCHLELSQTTVPLRAVRQGPHPLSEDASELLARWNAENLLTPETHSPPPSALEVHSAVAESFSTGGSAGSTSGAGKVTDGGTADTLASAASAGSGQTSSRRRSKHKSARSHLWAMNGSQLTAYLGVFLLTCGTATVVSGHFGNTPRTVMTGWLVATVGQMLLFLGVIGLIAAGLEQLRSDQKLQIRRLERRLLRRLPESAGAAKSARSVASRTLKSAG